MRLAVLLATALGAYAVALLATAPATLLDAGARQASQGRLRIADARGTLWSGSGQVEVRDAAGRTGITQRVTWRVLPAALLRGSLDCEVAVGAASRWIPVSLSLAGLRLSNADITLPAAVLGLGVPKIAPLGLVGELHIVVPDLSIAREGMRGSAILLWRGAGSSLSPIAPLGEYEIRFDGGGTTMQAALRTVSGPLWLDGKGTWKRGGNPAFHGRAFVSPQHHDQLAPLLRLIAADRGAGRFDLLLN